MRSKQPLTGQERDSDSSEETDQEGDDIADEIGEEDTDDESIDVPPNPYTQAVIEKLRAENTMLKEMAARREAVWKNIQEYKEKVTEMVKQIPNGSDQPGAVDKDNEEQKRLALTEIMEMLDQMDRQRQSEKENIERGDLPQNPEKLN